MNRFIRRGEPGSLSIIVKNVTNVTSLMSVSKNNLFYYNHEKFTLQYTLPKISAKLNDSKLFFPKLYYADDETNTLFLEDLREIGYESRTYPAGFDLEHCLMAMEILAKLHAGSHLLLQDEPELKKKYLNLPEPDSLPKQMVIKAEKCVREIVLELDLPEGFKEKFKTLANWQEKMEAIRKKTDNGLNVIIHNDVNRRNFMFQYVDGTVKDLKLIDFQMVTFNSVALELVCFIFRNGNTEVQTTEGVDKLLEHYYGTLTGITGEFPDFDLQSLKKEFKSKLFVGFLLTLLIYPLLAYPKKLELDFAAILNGDLIPWNKDMYNNPNFLQRFKELLPYFEENNVF